MTGTQAPPIFICIQQMTVVDCQSQTCCSIVFVRMGFVCNNTDSRNEYNSAETGFYYLQSRYYDPGICRFINADEHPSTGQDFIGTNMFAYCGNNPVPNKDTNGKFINTIIGAVVGGLIGGLSSWATGDGFWAGAAQGTVSGAISGLAVAITIAATGGAALAVGAIVLAGAGGVAGSALGECVGAKVRGEDFDWHDRGMWGRAAISGAINMASFGFATGFKYASGSPFNTSTDFKAIIKSMVESVTKVTPADIVVGTFFATHFAIHQQAVSLTA